MAKPSIGIANDGVAIPENFDPSGSHGLGMRIIQRLVTADLHGQFTMHPESGGSVATIRFPIEISESGEVERIGRGLS